MPSVRIGFVSLKTWQAQTLCYLEKDGSVFLRKVLATPCTTKLFDFREFSCLSKRPSNKATSSMSICYRSLETASSAMSWCRHWILEEPIQDFTSKNLWCIWYFARSMHEVCSRLYDAVMSLHRFIYSKLLLLGQPCLSNIPAQLEVLLLHQCCASASPLAEQAQGSVHKQ